MAKANRKIDLSAASPPLQDPFAALEGLALPEGEVVAASPKAEEKMVGARRGRLVLRRETAGRGGKTVVVVGDFPAEISEEVIGEMARDLRRALGCGGTVRGREVEVQGERSREVRAWLEAAGFRVVGP